MKKIYVPVGIENQVQELNQSLVADLMDLDYDVQDVVADYVGTLLMLTLGTNRGIKTKCIAVDDGNYRLIVKGAFGSDVFYGDSKSAAITIDSKVLLALLRYDSIDHELDREFMKIGINTEMQKMLCYFAKFAQDVDALRKPKIPQPKSQNTFERLKDAISPNVLMAAAVAIPAVMLLSSALMPTIAIATVLGCALTLGQIFTCASLIALACETAYGVYMLATNSQQTQTTVVSQPTKTQTLEEVIAGMLPTITSKLPLQNYEVQF